MSGILSSSFFGNSIGNKSTAKLRVSEYRRNLLILLSVSRFTKGKMNLFASFALFAVLSIERCLRIVLLYLYALLSKPRVSECVDVYIYTQRAKVGS